MPNDIAISTPMMQRKSEGYPEYNATGSKEEEKQVIIIQNFFPI